MRLGAHTIMSSISCAVVVSMVLEQGHRQGAHLSIVDHAVFAFASSAPPAFFISTSFARSFSATALAAAAGGREPQRRKSVAAAGSACVAFGLTL